MGLRDTKEGYNKYMREYHLKRYYRIREKAIEKLGGKCVKCQSVEELQFDHINPKDKKYEVSFFLSIPLKEFWEELKKCQLLCQEHHKIKSIIESGKKPAKGTHGTLSAYRYCKCDLCREAKSKWQKEYMKKRLTN